MKIAKLLAHRSPKGEVGKIVKLSIGLIMVASLIASFLWFTRTEPQVRLTADTYIGFNEGYGSTVSETVASVVTGTITNAVWKQEDMCLSGKCLFFDGTGDYVSFGDDADYDFTAAANWTISLWIRHAPKTSGTDTIIAKANASAGYKLYMESDGDITFAIDDDTTWDPDASVSSTAATYDDNRWHHIAAVKTGTTSIELYIDGVRVGRNLSVSGVSDLTNSANFYVGIDGDGSSNPFTGYIDELKVYTTAAATEVTVKADSLRGSPASAGAGAAFGPDQSYSSDGLAGYWKLDENTGTSASDFSGNSNTATLTNSPAWASGKYGTGVSVDGTNDYLTAADSASISVDTGVTVTGWVKMDETYSDTSDYNQGVVDKGDYKFYLDKSDGKAKWVVNDNVAKAFSAITTSGETRGTDNIVYSLAVYNGYLYVGGTFTTVGGTTVNNIVKYDDVSNTFSAIGGITVGTSGKVYCLTVYNSYLYLGGEFLTAGGTTVNYIAKYNDVSNSFSAIGGATVGTSNYVYSIAVYNSYLYVGGAFLTAGGMTVNSIVKYDDAGNTFSTIGGATVGTNDTTLSLVVYNGYLYVGGRFTTAGGTTVNRIAKYDDAANTFSAIGGATIGTSGTVYCLTVYNSYLYLGGSFATAGGTTVNNIAKYDDFTNTFSAIGGGTVGVAGTYYNVRSLAVHNGYLYVGGSFTTAGGTTVSSIAKYDDATNTFSAIGGARVGVDSYVIGSVVYSLTVFNGYLYVGGEFVMAGGTPVNYIAKYDDTSNEFTYLYSVGTGTGTSASIRSLAVYNGYLYVGGNFTSAGGTTVNNIAKYDDVTNRFSAMGTGGLGWVTDDVYSLTVYNGYLYVGGKFLCAGETTVNHIAKYDDATNTFSAIGGATVGLGTFDFVYSLAVYNNHLYLGGNFDTAGGTTVNHIAKYDDATNTFSAIGGATVGVGPGGGSEVYSLAIYNGYLYVGGDFTNAGGTTVNYIAKYDDATNTFSAIGGATVGTSYQIRSLAVYNGYLYLGGSFDTAGGTTVSRIAKYDDTANTFSAIGGATVGTSNYVYSIAVYNSYLYVGGSLITAGGITVNYIAKYDDATNTFSTIGGATVGTNGAVYTLAVYNGYLYAGGAFATAGGETVNYITKYGSTTSPRLAVSSSTSAWTAGNWYHVAGTFDGRDLKIFVNGQLEQSIPNSQTFSLDDSSKALLVGKTYGSQSAGGSGELLNGTLDEMRIYSRALSPAEIGSLYNRSPGPVGYWKLDENTGITAYDSSGNGNTGTLNNSPAWRPGQFGSAVYFDGASGLDQNDNISGGTATAIDDIFDGGGTISVWVYGASDGENTRGRILDKSNGTDTGWHLFLDNQSGATAQVRFRHYFSTDSATYYIAASDFNLNQWNHIELTYDNSGTANTPVVYINGMSKTVTATGTNTGTRVSDGSESLYIGNDATGTSTFDGLIDDIKLYNYTRTPGQITEDMNAGHPAPGSPIGSAYIQYSFDEGSGATAHNGGNGGSDLDAAITSGTWTNSGKFGRALTFTAGTSVADTISDPGYVNTISLWVYPTTSAASKTLVTAGKLTTDSSARPVYGGCTGTALATDVWTHLTAVSNGSGTCALYQNGILTSSGTTGVTFGTSLDIGGSSFTGTVDEFNFYNTAITPDQVKVLYNFGSAQSLGNVEDHTNEGTGTDIPVGWWPMEEGTGTSTISDFSGLAHDLTMNNLEAEDWGLYDRFNSQSRALTLDGSNEYLSLTDDADLDFGTGAFSLAAWVKHATTSAADYIIAKADATNGGYKLYMDDSGDFCLALDDDATWTPDLSVCTSGVDYDDGAWHHVAGVRLATNNYKLYVDGKIVAVSVFNLSNTISNTGTLYVGMDSDGSTGGWEGQLDEVRIYNYALTQPQVAYLYNRSKPFAWYKFDECSGTTINNSIVGASGSNAGLAGTITIGAGGSEDTLGDCSTSSTAWGNGATGKYNSSLDFDGTDDYVDMGDSNAFEFAYGAFTVETWVNRDTFSSNDIIASKKDALTLTPAGWYLAIQPNDTILFNWGNGTQSFYAQSSASHTITSSGWNHIVATFYGGSDGGYVYLNGRLAGTGTGSLGPFDNALNVRIGSLSNGTEPFDGKIDEVKFYNSYFTAEQVRVLYNEGRAVRFSP